MPNIFEDAHLLDHAKVTGNAMVFGNCRIFGNARIYGDAQIYEDAYVSGNALIYADGRVTAPHESMAKHRSRVRPEFTETRGYSAAALFTDRPKSKALLKSAGPRRSLARPASSEMHLSQGMRGFTGTPEFQEIRGFMATSKSEGSL